MKNGNNINKEILALFSGQSNTLSVPALYIKLNNGSYTRANVLNQCVYWSNKSELGEGWFHKEYEEWYEETLIPERTLRRIFTEFEQEGWIKTKVKKVRGINTKTIRPNIEKIMDGIVKLLSVQKLPQPAKVAERPTGQNGRSEPAKMSDSIYTDNYEQMITTDIRTLVDSGESPKKKSSLLTSNDYKNDKRFMQFYTIYPKKQKPRDAWKAFKALKLSDEQLIQILEDVKARTERHTQWQDSQFIPLPASYLRSGEFEGEIFNKAEQTEIKKKCGLEELKKRQEEQERFTRKQEEYQRTKQESYNQDKVAYRAIVNVAKNSKESATGSEQLQKLKQHLGCRR
jgi:hypothetical protein